MQALRRQPRAPVRALPERARSRIRRRRAASPFPVARRGTADPNGLRCWPARLRADVGASRFRRSTPMPHFSIRSAPGSRPNQPVRRRAFLLRRGRRLRRLACDEIEGRRLVGEIVVERRAGSRVVVTGTGFGIVGRTGRHRHGTIAHPISPTGHDGAKARNTKKNRLDVFVFSRFRVVVFPVKAHL